MNIARTICTIRNKNVGNTVFRKFRFTASNYDSTEASQPKVQEEKYDFEDLKVLERVEHRKAAIPPFMKNVFVSIFDRDLLAYPEVLNKDESEDLDRRVSRLEAVFNKEGNTAEERAEVLKQNQMYAAPVGLTLGGLAMNVTESIRYLETISSDLSLSHQLSDHWVALEALKAGLRADQFRQILDDLVGGEHTVSLCVKEKLAERISQADFRTIAEMDGQEVWRISGEKVCSATSGYFLVLGSSEAGRLRAFLVHPGAAGVSAAGGFVTFQKTPATPLDEVTEAGLARILGASRLHTATLCRCSLQRAMLAATDYIRDRVLNGKPLSELPTLRATVGDTLLDIYASESAEYFAAGLMDGFLDPDAELEVAMCRNFIASHSLARSLDLLSIPPLENQADFSRYFEDIRLLTFRGENQDGVNMFIALNGIHHAGKVMAEEIKQIRNPLFHPSFIVKKVIANRHQEKDDPKLDLYLAEHLHPSLRPAGEQLEYSVLRMRYACEAVMGRHGNKVGEACTSTRESYGDDAVGYVQLHRESGICTVKCKICPEHKVRASSYRVTMVVDETRAEIVSCECLDCAASSGGCKHAVAFLMWTHRRSEEPSCTEVECYWKKPTLSRVGTTMKYITVDELCKSKAPDHRPNTDVLTEYLQEAKKRKLSNCELLKYQADFNHSDVRQFSLHHSLIQASDEVKYDVNKLINVLQEMLNSTALSLIESSTRNQSKSPLWYELRYARITASKAFEVSRCQTTDGSLVAAIMGATTPDTSAMRRGRKLESSVLKTVQNKLKKKVKPCGLFLSHQYPMIAATPDGICSDAVVEVKCPTSDKTKLNYVNNGMITKKYKAQVQLQMYVTNLKKGYFCVAHPDFEISKKVDIMSIELDDEYVTDLLSTISSYWKANIYPLLIRSIS